MAMRAAALIGLAAVIGCDHSGPSNQLSYRTLPAQPVGEHPVTLAVLDADGDGDRDVAVPGLVSASLTILYNHGGMLRAGPVIELDSGAGSAAVGDLDGDGVDELLLSMAGAGLVARMQLTHDGFATTDSWSIDDPGPLAIGSLDGDGAVDVVVVQATLANSVLLRGDGIGGLTRSGTLLAPPATSSVCVDDIDGDGHADIAMTGGMTNELWIHRGGRLDRLAVGRWPMGLAAAQLDSDDEIELVFAANQGDGVFIADPARRDQDWTVHELDSPGQPSAVAAGDLDRDGHLDLVVAAKGGDRVDLLHGAGDGTLSLTGSLATGWGPSAVALVDLDADGCLDIAVVNAFSNDVTTYLCTPGAGPPTGSRVPF